MKKYLSPMPVVETTPERRERLDGVTVFVEVVRLGSLARAADHLGLTRSAVGKAMSRLESRLSARLFHRTTRNQSLTDEGQIYYEHCMRALAELQGAEQSIESSRTEVGGRLRVTTSVLFGRYCIAPLLLDLAKHHPALELHLCFDDRPVDVLAEGYDLAIRSGPIGVESEGLRARKLGAHHKLVVASPEYVAAHGSPACIAELSRHKILMYQRANRLNVWQFLSAEGAVVDVPLASRLYFDDLEMIADAAQSGFGLAWLPKWLIHDRLQKGSLVAVLENQPSLEMEIHALWPSTPHIPQRLRLAIDLLVERLPKLIE